MREVYQTIIDKGHGNCMQAAFASLFEDDLENVPNFIEIDNFFESMCDYARDKGYRFDGTLYNHKWQEMNDPSTGVFRDKPRFLRNSSLSCLKNFEGVNGLFYAGICSPKLYRWNDPCFHAVIVDKNCNIIFDPNPNYKGKIKKYPFADLIKYNGVIDVCLFNKI